LKPALSALSAVDEIDAHQTFLRLLSEDCKTFSASEDKEAIRDFLKLVADRLQTAGIVQPQMVHRVKVLEQAVAQERKYKEEIITMAYLEIQAAKAEVKRLSLDKEKCQMAEDKSSTQLPDNPRINLLDKYPSPDKPVVTGSTPINVSADPTIDPASTAAPPLIGSAAYLKRTLDNLVRPTTRCGTTDVDDSWCDYNSGWNAAIAKLAMIFQSDFGMEWPAKRSIRYCG